MHFSRYKCKSYLQTLQLRVLSVVQRLILFSLTTNFTQIPLRNSSVHLIKYGFNVLSRVYTRMQSDVEKETVFIENGVLDPMPELTILTSPYADSPESTTTHLPWTTLCQSRP